MTLANNLLVLKFPFNTKKECFMTKNLSLKLLLIILQITFTVFAYGQDQEELILNQDPSVTIEAESGPKNILLIYVSDSKVDYTMSNIESLIGHNPSLTYNLDKIHASTLLELQEKLKEFASVFQAQNKKIDGILFRAHGDGHNIQSSFSFSDKFHYFFDNYSYNKPIFPEELKSIYNKKISLFLLSCSILADAPNSEARLQGLLKQTFLIDPSEHDASIYAYNSLTSNQSFSNTVFITFLVALIGFHGLNYNMIKSYGELMNDHLYSLTLGTAVVFLTFTIKKIASYRMREKTKPILSHLYSLVSLHTTNNKSELIEHDIIESYQGSYFWLKTFSK